MQRLILIPGKADLLIPSQNANSVPETEFPEELLLLIKFAGRRKVMLIINLKAIRSQVAVKPGFLNMAKTATGARRKNWAV
jgi:hypothetical protein